MADDELEVLKAKRLAQLQAQQGPAGQADGQSQEAERRQQAEQMKNTMLSQILDQQARARLNTLMLAKPEKAQMVENMLINMARSGQLRGKLGEDEFKGLLEQVSEKMQKTTTVKFDRRRINLSDDEEDYDL